MKRFGTILAVEALLLALSAGAALAATFYGTNGPDTIYGTNGDDSRDHVYCGPGVDTVKKIPGPGASNVFTDGCKRVVQ